MSKVSVYVGLDYHKDSIQVCVMDRAGKILANRRCTNQVEALVRLVATFSDDVHAAVESCTGAAALAEELATRHGWSISLAHPGYVARMKQAPDKPDRGDARVLADLVRVGYLPKVWLAPAAVRQLRTLVRYRQQLVAQRRAIKQRVGALLRDARVEEPCSRWTKAWFVWVASAEGLGSEAKWVINNHIKEHQHISTLIADAEQRLCEVTDGDPVIGEMVALKGVGLITAATIRAEVGRFDLYSGRRSSSF